MTLNTSFSNSNSSDKIEYHFFDFDDHVPSSKIEKPEIEIPLITPILGRYSKGEKKNQYYNRGYSSIIKIPDKSKTEIEIFTKDYNKNKNLHFKFNEINKRICEFFKKNENELLDGGILHKHNFTKDITINKMIREYLKKNNKLLQLKNNANKKMIDKIHNYTTKCNKNGYKEKELLKAMETLKKPVNIDKPSHLQALVVFYVHMCNDKLFLDHISSKKQDMEIILKNCIEFCKLFEEMEVCIISQDAIFKIKTDISSLSVFDNIPEMLKNFKQVEKYLKMEKEREKKD